VCHHIWLLISEFLKHVFLGMCDRPHSAIKLVLPWQFKLLVFSFCCSLSLHVPLRGLRLAALNVERAKASLPSPHSSLVGNKIPACAQGFRGLGTGFPTGSWQMQEDSSGPHPLHTGSAGQI
jgi:hypothetical protein